MPRIVSLIASATEIVTSLGMGDSLVGRSHECDYPESVRRLPVCTAPRFDVTGSSREIDERVKATLQSAVSVYEVHRDVLRELKPDVIITQTQCEVCAVSEKDVVDALCSWIGTRPTVISLKPNALVDVWDDIERVAGALGCEERGSTLVRKLETQLRTIRGQALTLPQVQTVACLEWLDPLMAAGNWTPELVEIAGGFELFGQIGKHSPWMTWEDLVKKDPQVIVAMPCGFDLERTRTEMKCLTGHANWKGLRAVREGRVYITDGNQYFNRPGPRLVESAEILAEIFHPTTFSYGHRGTGWEQVR